MDSAAVANDRNLFPVDEGQNVGFAYPRFGGSKAERLMKLDVSNGEHKKMKPKELKLTRRVRTLSPLCLCQTHSPRIARTQGKVLLVGKEEERRLATR
jgi:hypothetical protein